MCTDSTFYVLGGKQMVILFYDPQTSITQSWHVSTRYRNDISILIRQYRRLSAARIVKQEWIESKRLQYAKKGKYYYFKDDSLIMQREYEEDIQKRMKQLQLQINNRDSL